MGSDGRIKEDLGAINVWLGLTRLRAVALISVIVVIVWMTGAPISPGPAYAVLAALAAFSVWGHLWRRRGRAELRFFYAQNFVDLAAITIGIGASAAGPLGLLFRPLFTLVIVPASLVSVRSGLAVASGATLGHEILLGLEQGFSAATLLSFDSIAPALLFFLIAQQCFFYGAHLKEKNQKLASLAESLDQSRSELAEIAQRNSELLEEAREASALKSEFVSTMSHELRTPLNVILGYTEILQDESDESWGEARDLLGRIETCGRDLLELVDATLQVGRLEAGAIQVQPAWVSVAELMDEFSRSTAGLPHDPGVELRWECSAEPTGSIETDRAKVALIVRNLVSNGLKFTEKGFVAVALRSGGGHLEIEVRDTGVGIPEDKLPVMFEMFRQVGGPGSRQAGVGLGLYIVDQLVRRLDGSMTVESMPGLGTAFFVRLPRYRAGEQPLSALPL